MSLMHAFRYAESLTTEFSDDLQTQLGRLLTLREMVEVRIRVTAAEKQLQSEIGDALKRFEDRVRGK